MRRKEEKKGKKVRAGRKSRRNVVGEKVKEVQEGR